VDTIARFVAPGVVVCMRPSGSFDPNLKTLVDIERDLCSFWDARGRRLKVVSIPSPGRVVDSDGAVLPASYINVYIANRTVVVPSYGSPWDEEARGAIARLFPGRRTVSLPAKQLLSGGGAFHCITQQQPQGSRQ
jgi:agmatine deiminase